MNKPAKVEVPTGLELLRQPFEPHHISKLPKPTKAQTDAVKADFKKGIRCKECGAWHHPDVVHLDYVGHAALTDRLLECDPFWNWEPQGRDEFGLPLFDRNGGLWINLTVCGVTRPGYGDADGKQGGNAVKEAIGDAMRNAAMRFGAALDLWHKGELHPDMPDEGAARGQGQEEGAVSPTAPKQPAYSKLKTELRAFVHELEGIGDWDQYCAFRDTKEFQRLIAECQEKLPQWWDGGPDMSEEFVPLSRRIEILEANLAAQIAQTATA